MFNSWSQKASERLDQLLNNDVVSQSLSNVQLASSSFLKKPQPSSLARPAASNDPTFEYLFALERRALHLQRQLQSLLDDQASLLAPHLPGLREDVESKPLTATGVMPVRQPQRSRPSLNLTRNDIGRLMVELSDLKAEEQDVLDVALAERQTQAEQAGRLAERRMQLQEEIGAIQQDPQSQRMRALREEGDVVQEQINSMEVQLENLRSNHRTIKSELSRLENSVQSKLSSYTGSLKLLESEIQRALLETPVAPVQSAGASSIFMALPQSRRTLEMMTELVKEERALFQARQDSARVEQEALEAGASVWKETVDAVASFEGQLKREISLLGQPRSLVSEETTESKTGAAAIEGLVERLDGVVKLLEQRLKEAEVHGWNLLVCTIGAELEALRKGHTILGSLRPHSPAHESSPVREFVEETNDQQMGSSSSRRRRMSSDDEPDPDLLLAAQDTDTDYESSI